MTVRVVVVDDLDDIRLLLRHVLGSRRGIEIVAEAATGQEAIAVAAVEQPDVVVLDVGLPDLAGHEVLARLRLAAPDAKVVVFTGNDSQEAVRRSADGLVLKTAGVELLAHMLEEVATATGMAASLELPPDPSVVRLARAFVADRCETWDCRLIVDSAMLIVSELVTNAIVHAGTRASLTLRRRVGALRIEVTDAVVTSPDPRVAEPTDEGGRGLLLVSAMTTAWGVEPRPNGKVVWAELPCGERALAST